MRYSILKLWVSNLEPPFGSIAILKRNALESTAALLTNLMAGPLLMALVDVIC